MLPLDANAMTYNNILITKIERRKHIVSYLPHPFDSEQAEKIHLIAELGQISPSNSSNDGLSNVGLPTGSYLAEHVRAISNPSLPKLSARITRRGELCFELEKTLATHSFVQVRGTPACGKSTFLHLFQAHMQSRYPRALVYRISRWPPDGVGLQPLKDVTRNPSFPAKVFFPTYLLIDEAQVTYGDAVLWSEFKSMVTFENIWIVLFCSYGSTLSTMDRVATPDRFGPERVLGLWGSGLARRGLLFSRDEFDDVILRSAVLLTPEVASAIFDLSAGHAGAVAFLLCSIQTKNHDTQAHGIFYTLKQFHEQHPAYRLARDFPESSPGRGLPRYGELGKRPEIAKMFRELLRVGYIPQDETNQAIQYAHKEGWIYWSRIEGGKDGGDAFFIASPLHAACLSWSLMPSAQQLTHASILELTIECISRFKLSQIFYPYQAAGPVSSIRVLEAQYQAEFYRSLHQLANGEVQIMPEFASGKGAEVAGRLDFVIPSMKWGFEITREGAKLQQHSDRFSQDGAYGEMITEGFITDYILVDCRTTQPRKAHPDIPKLFHAVFNMNKSSVTILNNPL